MMAYWNSEAYAGHRRQSVCPWGENVLYDGGRPNGNLQERLDGQDENLEHQTIRPVLRLGSGEHHKDLGWEGGKETAPWSCLMVISPPKKGKD